jgi:hypothetical protein
MATPHASDALARDQLLELLTYHRHGAFTVTYELPPWSALYEAVKTSMLKYDHPVPVPGSPFRVVSNLLSIKLELGDSYRVLDDSIATKTHACIQDRIGGITNDQPHVAVFMRYQDSRR